MVLALVGSPGDLSGSEARAFPRPSLKEDLSGSEARAFRAEEGVFLS
jgi:hypothetical protein